MLTKDQYDKVVDWICIDPLLKFPIQDRTELLKAVDRIMDRSGLYPYLSREDCGRIGE